MFTRIEKEVNKKRNTTLKENKAYILSTDNIERYLTPAKLRDFKAGIIPLKEAQKIAWARHEKEINKRFDRYIEMLHHVSTRYLPSYIDISVNWNTSRTWGMNPKAELRDGAAYYEATCSGCGYDKLSTVTSNTLNQSARVKAALFTWYESYLGKRNKPAIPYGINTYNGYPAFSGGVGQNCINSALETIGYTVHHSSGRTYDGITANFTNEKKRQKINAKIEDINNEQ